MKPVQELLQDDPDRRIEFCETIMNSVDNGQILLDWILFSDDATFTINGEGGDWGSAVSQHLSILHPENVIGLHSNFYMPLSGRKAMLKMLLGCVFPWLIVDEKEREFTYPLSRKIVGIIYESGYYHVQATKPDSVSGNVFCMIIPTQFQLDIDEASASRGFNISYVTNNIAVFGVALRDSPVGLAAYILEKFTTGTNPRWRDRDDGGLTEKFTMDQLLDNVMIYWLTRSETTSARLYAEYTSKAYQALNLNAIPIMIPSGMSRFPNEIFYAPKSILKDKFTNLVYVKDHDVGGHFAAFEEPQLLADDVFEFVSIVEKLLKKTDSKEL